MPNLKKLLAAFIPFKTNCCIIRGHKRWKLMCVPSKCLAYTAPQRQKKNLKSTIPNVRKESRKWKTEVTLISTEMIPIMSNSHFKRSCLQKVKKIKSEPKESPAKIHFLKKDSFVSEAPKEINWINIKRNLSSQDQLLESSYINQMPQIIKHILTM